MLFDFNANLDNPFDSTSNALRGFGVANNEQEGEVYSNVSYDKRDSEFLDSHAVYSDALISVAVSHCTNHLAHYCSGTVR